MKWTFLHIAIRSLTTFAGTKLCEALHTIKAHEDSEGHFRSEENTHSFFTTE